MNEHLKLYRAHKYLSKADTPQKFGWFLAKVNVGRYNGTLKGDTLKTIEGMVDKYRKEKGY